jgi:hypothetical protein
MVVIFDFLQFRWAESHAKYCDCKADYRYFSLLSLEAKFSPILSVPRSRFGSDRANSLILVKNEKKNGADFENWAFKQGVMTCPGRTGTTFPGTSGRSLTAAIKRFSFEVCKGPAEKVPLAFRSKKRYGQSVLSYTVTSNRVS